LYVRAASAIEHAERSLRSAPTLPARNPTDAAVSAALHRRHGGARAQRTGNRVHNITRLTATGGGGGRAADPAVTAAAFTVAITIFYDSRRLSNASALDRAGAARILAQVAHSVFADRVFRFRIIII